MQVKARSQKTLRPSEIPTRLLHAPIPWDEMPLDHEEIPRPARLPEEPSEADLAKAEKRLELTQQRDRGSVVWRPKNNDKRAVKKTIQKLERLLDSGQLSEQDAYDVLVNLHLLKDTLKHMDSAARVVARFTGAV